MISNYFNVKFITHGFMVYNIKSFFFYTLSNFIKRWRLVDRNSSEKNPSEKPFYIYNKYEHVYIFHIGQWESFLEFLRRNNVDSSFYTIEYDTPLQHKQIDYKLITDKTPKDFQEEAKDFIISKGEGLYTSRLVCLPTGTGKTFSFLYTLTFLKQKTFIPISPGYMDQWCNVIQETLNVKKNEIMTIRGSSELKDFLAHSVSGDEDDFKIIVCSIDTYRNYVKAYEERGSSILSEGYSCLPHEMSHYAKIGCVLYDEIHENLNLVFKIMACTQAQIQVGLSATFLSKDSFVLHIQKTMFPKEFRYDKVKMPKYIKLYSIAYSFENMREAKIKTMSWGSNTYSHVEYEKSILKRRRTTDNYLELIASISSMLCQDQLVEGDKYLIFASMKEMCTAIKEKLTPIYKDLKVNTYLSGDPRSNIDSDIIISTLGSAGTALDIPNLRRVLMTTSVDSPVANKQALGRLRDLSAKNKDVKFAYLYCDQLAKHKQYHYAKQKLFAESVVYHKDLYYSFKL